MNGANPPSNLPRSIGAILAGIAFGIISSLATDQLLRVAGLFPPISIPMGEGQFAVATLYRTAYGVAGSYLTGCIAPRRPMLHAMILGVLGMIAAAAGAAAAWDKGPEFGPRWYPLTLVALSLPQSWAGGRLAEMRYRK